MQVGDTLPLTATAKDAKGNVIGSSLSGLPVSWSSSNTAVASVDQTGLVIAKGQGTATITATIEGVSGTANVTVTNRWKIEYFRFKVITDPPENVLFGLGQKVYAMVTGLDPSGNEITSGFHINWRFSNGACRYLGGDSPDPPCATFDGNGGFTTITTLGRYDYCAYVCVSPVVTDDTGGALTCLCTISLECWTNPTHNVLYDYLPLGAWCQFIREVRAECTEECWCYASKWNGRWTYMTYDCGYPCCPY